MKPFYVKTMSVVLAGSLLVAACGDDDDDTTTPTSGATESVDNGDSGGDTGGDTTGTATSSPTETGAASLRAGLTSLLQEHLYLAAIALETALDAGGNLEDPAVVAATAALDENSVALADAVGSIAGPENGEAFLGLWREHIGFFVNYTLGKATGDEAMAEQAKVDLDGYKQAASAFFEDITGGAVTADAVAGVLAPHASTTFAAIDALVAGEATTFDLVREAGQVMPDIAAALSGAIVTALPDTFDGDPASPASETRAVLTHLLQEHVYLAGIAIEQAVEAGGDLEAPAVQASVGTLDANSVALADVVGSVAGAENGEAFLGLWREHIGFFVDYTLGKATGDDAMVNKAVTDLDGYKQAAGDFFETITGGELPAAALVSVLDGHTSTLFATIDSLIAGDGQVFTLLRQAAQHMPMSAAALAKAVVAATS